MNNKIEIGSIFEVNPKIEKENNFKVEGNRVYTSSCRESLVVVLRTILEQNSNIRKTIYVSSYMCDSVIETILNKAGILFFII